MALPGVDIEKIEAEVQAQCDALPRNEVARQALSHSCIVMAASKVSCLRVSHLGLRVLKGLAAATMPDALAKGPGSCSTPRCVLTWCNGHFKPYLRS